MKVYQMICPNCGANLDVNPEEELDFIFCKYCGHRSAVDYESMMPQVNFTKQLKSEEKKLGMQYAHEERVYEIKNQAKKNYNVVIIIGLTIGFIITIFALYAILLVIKG